MQIVLEKLDIFDYNEETDHIGDLKKLIRGCTDSVVDYLYVDKNEYEKTMTSEEIRKIKQNIMSQLEFTARAIMVKLGVDLDKEVFGREVILLDSDVACMGRLLIYLGHALIQITHLDNKDYDQNSIYEFIKNLSREAYIVITGATQAYICQQMISSKST